MEKAWFLGVSFIPFISSGAGYLNLNNIDYEISWEGKGFSLESMYAVKNFAHDPLGDVFLSLSTSINLLKWDKKRIWNDNNEEYFNINKGLSFQIEQKIRIITLVAKFFGGFWVLAAVLFTMIQKILKKVNLLIKNF